MYVYLYICYIKKFANLPLRFKRKKKKKERKEGEKEKEKKKEKKNRGTKLLITIDEVGITSNANNIQLTADCTLTICEDECN